MTDGIPQLAARLAADLPSSDVASLAASARRGSAAVAEWRARAGSARLRAACNDILRTLDHQDDFEFLAGCLAGAAAAIHDARKTGIDVVWTGPASEVDTSRLTSAVVADLIGQTARELLLVSYATWAEARIVDAVRGATGRGAEVTVVFERHEDNPRYQHGPDAFADIPIRRVVWPGAHRPLGASLHPKLIVVDRETALVGSANLTGRALDVNLECGVVLRGGAHPRAIAAHVESLVRSGELLVLPK